MLLTDYISKSHVALDVKARGRAEAIEQVAHVLLRRKPKAMVEAAVQQLLTREAMESTGIGRGVAIPHARVPDQKNLTCAVGRLEKELDFRSVDHKPVSLVFLICYPPPRQTAYLNFAATIARLLQDDERLRLLRAATSPAEMYRSLEEISAVMARPEEQFSQAHAAGKAPDLGAEASRSLTLLARLQLCEEMLETARSGKPEIRKRIDGISALLEPRILKHYRGLRKRPGPAVVPVEHGVCGGCSMKLPSQFAQQVRRESGRVHLCSFCNRFIYQV